MLELKGSHGTSVTSANSIVQQGFRSPKADGRFKGTYLPGVYFWRHGRFADELANGWWKRESDRGSYRKHKDKHCAVVHALLSVEEDCYFDMEDAEAKEALWELAEETGLKTVKDRAKLYDRFIEAVEQDLKAKVKVVELRVALPNPYFDFYPMKILGPPWCYAVRDTSCVEVLDVLEGVQ